MTPLHIRIAYSWHVLRSFRGGYTAMSLRKFARLMSIHIDAQLAA